MQTIRSYIILEAAAFIAATLAMLRRTYAKHAPHLFARSFNGSPDAQARVSAGCSSLCEKKEKIRMTGTTDQRSPCSRDSPCITALNTRSRLTTAAVSPAHQPQGFSNRAPTANNI